MLHTGHASMVSVVTQSVASCFCSFRCYSLHLRSLLPAAIKALTLPAQTQATSRLSNLCTKNFLAIFTQLTRFMVCDNRHYQEHSTSVSGVSLLPHRQWSSGHPVKNKTIYIRDWSKGNTWADFNTESSNQQHWGASWELLQTHGSSELLLSYHNPAFSPNGYLQILQNYFMLLLQQCIHKKGMND